jgi:hypothetical protein
VFAACGGGGDGGGPDGGRLDDAALPADGAPPHPDAPAVDAPPHDDVPAAWTCGAPAYGDGYCDCGCGAPDPDCPSPTTLDSCGSSNGCTTGTWPDPDDPSTCVARPAGWTCSEARYTDTTCSCGCGIADPACAADLHISECEQDGCPSGQSPDPTEVTQCMTNAPEDRWSCPLTALADGATCDCGCGAIDPDCGANPTAAACEATHCPAGDDLKPDDIGHCWEVCEATAPAGTGSATCTNGGSFSFGGLACERDASACSDGHSYEIECDGGECSCRIDGQCVGHAETTACGFSACGWAVTGPS